MKFIADLHIHSHYSRATSKNLNFENLARWAQLKGVHVVGTGDIAHPGWLAEMHDKLEPAETGLFRLKAEYARAVEADLPPACRQPVRFLLAGEISSIYKKFDKVRKVHNVIFAPTLDAVAKIQAALEKIGNIRSDGRPILGLDSRDLLEIILDIDDRNHLIPAHIWTPWFSMLGSKSGFDSVEACFGDLTPHIFALETGLSSDPPMNWRVSMLDGYTLVSNSDAHSPQKLAREANIFNTGLAYPAIFEALKTGDPRQFGGTIEFFPEEGKYHYDGHRKCGVCWEPKTTLAHNGLCSACGKKVTVGVSHRVEVLADRPAGEKPARAHPFFSIIPLPEILSEVYNVGPTSKRVRRHFEALLAQLGPELGILLDAPLPDIERAGGPLLAEGIRRIREKEVSLQPGFDGEFGVIQLFTPEERKSLAGQMTFLAAPAPKRIARPQTAPPPVDGPSAPQPDVTQPSLLPPPMPEAAASPLHGLNPQQLAAVQCVDSPLVIVAGPGTGKTRTLTHRLAHLIAAGHATPGQILAIAFTNKAAEEMAARLAALLGDDLAGDITVCTFHALGAMILRAEAASLGMAAEFAICAESDRPRLLKQACPDLPTKAVNRTLNEISAAKNRGLLPDSPALDDALRAVYEPYQRLLRQRSILDFDDLLLQTIHLFDTRPSVLAAWQGRFRWLAVDEYQDTNPIQYRLLRLLAAGGANVCVIGDPDQAIYGFRGAERGYFLQFTRDFPDAKQFTLTQNYRSIQPILTASGQVIAQNSDSRHLAVWSEWAEAARLTVYSAPTEKAEAEYVVHRIEQMVGGTSYFSLDSGRVDDRIGADEAPAGRAFGDFAVLFRLGAQSAALVEAFERSGIPYQLVGKKSLADFPDVRQVLACLWFCYNPQSMFYLEPLLNGGKTLFNADALARLQAAAGEHRRSLADMVWAHDRLDGFSPAQHNRLAEVAAFSRDLLYAAAFEPVTALVEKSAGFVEAACPGLFTTETPARLKQMMALAASFDGRLEAFLTRLALHKETDTFDPRADRVALMTLHAAKGLEFPVVFVVGCEEGLLPYRRGTEPPNVPEERRLFYVGMTRARQDLILTHAKKRLLFGKWRQNAPSRFVDEIESNLKAWQTPTRRAAKPQPPPADQLSLF